MAKKKKRDIYSGIVEKNRRGFGFVKCEEMDRDIFVSAASMNGAMNGDEVEVDLMPEYLWKDSPEGIVTRIISRNTVEVVGTFEKSKKFGAGKQETKGRYIRKKERFFRREERG